MAVAAAAICYRPAQFCRPEVGKINSNALEFRDAAPDPPPSAAFVGEDRIARWLRMLRAARADVYSRTRVRNLSHPGTDGKPAGSRPTVPGQNAKSMSVAGLIRMRWWLTALVAAIAGGLLIVLSLRSYPPADAELAGGLSARVVEVDSATTALVLRQDGQNQPFLTVPKQVAAAVVKRVSIGDEVAFAKEGAGNVDLVQVRERVISTGHAAGVLLLVFAATWLLILTVTNGHPWAFILGIDQRLSNSQTQIYLWFLVFAMVYFSEFALRLLHTGYFGGIGVPANLLALSGVSALTFAGARANATVKDTAPKSPPPMPRTKWQLFLDLFTSDATGSPNGRFSLGDFQMILLTWAAIAIYLTTSVLTLTHLAYASHVDLPPVDDALLGGTAVSQGAYLFKKFASPPGH